MRGMCFSSCRGLSLKVCKQGSASRQGGCGKELGEAEAEQGGMFNVQCSFTESHQGILLI